MKFKVGDNVRWKAGCFEHVGTYREPAKEAAMKDDDNKSRLDILLGCRGISDVGDVFAYGAKKYDMFNWRKAGNDIAYKSRLCGAALRHIYAYLTGTRLDPETNKHHLAHAIADLAMVIDLENQ